LTEPRPQRTGLCIWCGKGPLTDEHLWPKWLRKRGIVSADPLEHLSGQDAPAEKWERNWRAPDATRTAAIVCEPCNTGWMNDLEAAAAPILEPMMRGEARTLDVAEQDIVALWAAKMTMVWEATHPHVRAVSDEDYEHVFRWRTPPTGWRVWLAAYAPPPDPPPPPDVDEAEWEPPPPPWSTYVYKHPLRLLPATTHHADRSTVRAEEVNGHLATFGVGAFVFQTFGAFGGLDVSQPAILHERRFARYLRQIGPFVTSIRWPPPAILDDAMLYALTEGGLAE
jgi:hypothetical protein